MLKHIPSRLLHQFRLPRYVGCCSSVASPKLIHDAANVLNFFESDLADRARMDRKRLDGNDDDPRKNPQQFVVCLSTVRLTFLGSPLNTSRSGERPSAQRYR